jgi:heme-degrading monooxygenase HmoA
MPGHYIAIWQFEIKAKARPQFESIYGPEGAWAQLFRHSPEYRGTRLLRDITRPDRYLTLDYWTSREALQQFKRDYDKQYAVLDRQCEALTQNESMVGEFTAPKGDALAFPET